MSQIGQTPSHYRVVEKIEGTPGLLAVLSLVLCGAGVLASWGLAQENVRLEAGAPPLTNYRPSVEVIPGRPGLWISA